LGILGEAGKSSPLRFLNLTLPPRNIIRICLKEFFGKPNEIRKPNNWGFPVLIKPIPSPTPFKGFQPLKVLKVFLGVEGLRTQPNL